MSDGPFRVVLSGASGMLGVALRGTLAGRNIPALQLVRGTPVSSRELAWNPAAEAALDNPAMLEGFDAAIHLSGASLAGRRWTSEYRRELKDSRVRSTQALTRVLAGLRHPPGTLLVASAIGIYGDRGEEVLEESSPPGTGFLAQLCDQWESAARPAAEAGIRVVNLRIGVVLGSGKGVLAQILLLFRLGLGGRLGSGRQWMSWISLMDAVNAILFAMEKPELVGPLNLTAPQQVRNAEFTCALARQLGRPAALPVPAFALRLALGQMADEALLTSARVSPAKLLAEDFSFTHPALDDALAAALA